MEQRNLVGDTILGYEVVAQIGSGAFGTVYKAVKNSALGEYVRALKHISLPTRRQYSSVLNSMGGDAEKTDCYFAEMLNGIASEISLLSALSEKKTAHIVRYYESDLETQEAPLRYDVYMLMEYATPLLDYIQQKGSFTVRDVVGVGLDSLEGIRVCHENGVIHRDIKEDNIFVSLDGDYEIGDFGVSKVLRDSSRAESLKGTPNYLAPEVYLNKGGYTKSVDLYALGIVLYRLLNRGRNPFMPPFPKSYLAEDEDAAFEMRMRGLAAPAPALGSVQIHDVILKAISPEGERYGEASSFISDLEEALKSTPAHVLDEEIGYFSSEGVGEAAEGDRFAEPRGTIRVGIGPLCGEADRISDCVEDDRDCWAKAERLADSDARPTEGSITDNEAACEDSDYDETHSSKLEETKSNAEDGCWARSCCDQTVDGEGPLIERKAQDKTSTLVLASIFVISAMMALVSMSSNQVVSGLGAVCAFVSLIGALFFVGRSIQGRGKASRSAILVNKEPQMVAADARFDFFSSANGSKDPGVKLCLSDLKRLEERLSAEPKFGCGNDQVMIYENEIAGCLERISVTASMTMGKRERIEELRGQIREVNHLLDKRRMLMRR